MKRGFLLLSISLVFSSAFSQDAGIDSMLQKIAVEKDDNLRFDIIYRSLVAFGESDPVSGIKYTKALLDFAQQHGDKIAESYATSFMGKLYVVSGNMEKGLAYALKGNETAEKTGNGKLIAFSNTMVGLVYKNLANYPKAYSFYHASEQAAEKANIKQAQVWAFQNLSEIYLATNNIDSALIYAQKDYELAQRARYYDFISYTMMNLGTIHGNLGNTPVALGYFDMAIQESLRSGSPRQLNRVLTAKAEYFNAINKKDSCILFAKKAIAAVENTGFTTNRIRPAELLLNMYRGNNVDSAFKYSEMYRVANDSLFSTKAIQQTQLMTFEDEIRQQKAVEEKIMTEQQRKQNIQYALLALGIITFVILFLALSRRHITNTKVIQFLGVVALLVVFEFLNLLLHPFLERVTHHNPILMLLALVCIAAILVPLHHRLEKWATNKLVEKNKQIRLAAAKKTIEQLEDKQNS